MTKLKRKEKRTLTEQKRLAFAKEISQAIRDAYETAYTKAIEYLKQFGGKEFKTMVEGEAKDRLINQRINIKALLEKAVLVMVKKYPAQEVGMIREAAQVWKNRLNKFVTARKL